MNALSGARQQANITQMADAHRHSIDQVIVFALRKLPNLGNNFLGPLLVGRINHLFGKKVLHRIQPRQLVHALGVRKLHGKALISVQAPQFLRHRDASGLVFDQQLVNLQCLAGLGDLFDQIVELQTLLPRMHQHQFRRKFAVGAVKINRTALSVQNAVRHRSRVSREHTPDGQSRIVVVGFGGVGGVQGRDDVIHGRERALLPQLPPLALDHAAPGRLRTLLQLPSGHEWPQTLLQLGNFFLAKPVRPQQITLVLARVFPANAGHKRAISLVAHRQAQMGPAVRLFLQNVARQVIFSQSLLNDDVCARLHVVQTGAHGPVPPLLGGLNAGLGEGFGR